MNLSNRFGRLAAVLSVAAAACVAVLAVTQEVVSTAFSYAKRGADWLISWVLDKTAMFAHAEPGRTQPAVQIVRTVAFKARLMSRERLDMQAGYRLCPSI